MLEVWSFRCLRFHMFRVSEFVSFGEDLSWHIFSIIEPTVSWMEMSASSSCSTEDAFGFQYVDSVTRLLEIFGGALEQVKINWRGGLSGIRNRELIRLAFALANNKSMQSLQAGRLIAIWQIL